LQSGKENQYQLHEEMGRIMTDNVTVVRYNDRLKETDDRLRQLLERYETHLNQRFKSLGDYGSAACPAFEEHVGSGARDYSRRAQSQRVARRALQAGLSGCDESELAEDNDC